MRIRLWKELRALMPYWIGLMLMVLAAWFLRGRWLITPYDLQMLQQESPQDVYRSIFARYAGAAHFAVLGQLLVFHLAAVSLFSQEFTWHAIDRLLSQPISRNRIWFEKSLAFLIMVLSSLAANSVLGEAIKRELLIMAPARTQLIEYYALTKDLLAFSASGGALALASGPLMALLIRQTRTAFLASLVLPALILVILVYLDYTIVQQVFGTAFSDWANAYFLQSLGEFNLMILFTIPWFLVVFPLGWLKFKRLEV